MKKPYVVCIQGQISVDTTVAVIAESEKEAEHMALDGVRCDPEEWLRGECLDDDPVVREVLDGTPLELAWADQKHLLGPQLQKELADAHAAEVTRLDTLVRAREWEGSR